MLNFLWVEDERLTLSYLFNVMQHVLELSGKEVECLDGELSGSWWVFVLEGFT